MFTFLWLNSSDLPIGKDIAHVEFHTDPNQCNFVGRVTFFRPGLNVKPDVNRYDECPISEAEMVSIATQKYASYLAFSHQ